jgi:GrpB-like predicted nucleotidyltransferase (UPF0157 family)
MSLPLELLSEFDKSMAKAGFPDRSKAIQTALHSFIDENDWRIEDEHLGAGSIMVVYNNHIYNQDTKSTQTQHKYNDVINAATHIQAKICKLKQSMKLEDNKLKGRRSTTTLTTAEEGSKEIILLCWNSTSPCKIVSWCFISKINSYFPFLFRTKAILH